VAAILTNLTPDGCTGIAVHELHIAAHYLSCGDTAGGVVGGGGTNAVTFQLGTTDVVTVAVGTGIVVFNDLIAITVNPTPMAISVITTNSASKLKRIRVHNGSTCLRSNSVCSFWTSIS
jgi:hypothetical protein